LFSNFYEDYSVNYDQFEYMVSVYGGLGLLTNEYIEQVKRNIIIPQIETYRFIPIQRINVDSAFYSLETILQNSDVITKLNLDGTSLDQRINKWENELTLEEKIEVLFMLNLFLQLEAKRNLPVEPNSKIIDFDMFSKAGELLLRNTNYNLLNNKIYLNGDIGPFNLSRDVNLKDIAVDLNTPYNLMGNKIIPFMDRGAQTLFNDKLTKNEYTEMMKMILQASLGGPTIINLKNAIKTLSGLSNADVYDKYVKDPKKRKRWDGWDLFNFNFIVTLPEDYISDLDKLEILSGFLNMIKPAYTKFFIILVAEYYDYFNKSNSSDAYNFDYISEISYDQADLTIGDIYDIGSIFGLDAERYIIPTRFTNNEARLNLSRLNEDFKTFSGSKVDGGYADSTFNSGIDGGYADSEFDGSIDGGVVTGNLLYFHFDKLKELQNENVNLSIDDNYHEDYFSDLHSIESYDNIIEGDIKTTINYAQIKLNSTKRLNVDFRTCRFPLTEEINY